MGEDCMEQPYQANNYRSYSYSQNGLNPSVASPRRTLRASRAKSGHLRSTCFQDEESTGWRMIDSPATKLAFACHLILFVIQGTLYSLCNLGVNGKFLSFFQGKGFFLALSELSGHHMLSPHVGQLFLSSCSL